MAPEHESVTAVLTDQHDRIRELLAEVRKAGPGERGQVFDGLRALLAAHETGEEVVIRPVSVQVVNRDLIAARNHEERHIVRFLADLERLDAATTGFAEAFEPFARELLAHLAVEEADEFPVLEAEVSVQESRAMARWMERAVAIGPRHAHPFVAGSPFAQRATSPFTALLDHARDRFEHTRPGNAAHDSSTRV